MSLNKHKIIPLIESYYHTFTPLERTIADFFIHNTEEQDFSSRNISGLLYVSEASLSRFAQKCGFHGYREFIYEYKQRLAPGPEENIPNFEVSERSAGQSADHTDHKSAGFQTSCLCLRKRQFRSRSSGDEASFHAYRTEYRSSYRQSYYEGEFCYSG